MACKFIWGEVKELNGEQKTATYKPIFTSERDRVNSHEGLRPVLVERMMMRVPRLDPAPKVDLKILKSI